MLPNHRLRRAIAAYVLVTAADAYAQNATPTASCPPETNGCPQPPPQPTTSCPPENACPQPEQQPQPPPLPVLVPGPVRAPEEPTTPPWYDRIGWGLFAGGGVDDFVSGTAANVTNIGGGWNVRLMMGTKTWFAAEAVYIGSAQGVSDVLGLDTGANLVSNGLQADARFNMTRNYFLQPFIYSGVAWRHYDLTNVDFNTSDVTDSANVVEVPFGWGLAGYWRNLIADVRGEYRWAWGDRVTLGDDDADRWNVMANIGIAFR